MMATNRMDTDLFGNGAWSKELLRVLNTADELPPSLHDVWMLRYVSGMTVEQIAQRLGCPQTTVEYRLRRLHWQMDQTVGVNNVWNTLKHRPVLFSRLFALLFEEGRFQSPSELWEHVPTADRFACTE